MVKFCVKTLALQLQLRRVYVNLEGDCILSYGRNPQETANRYSVKKISESELELYPNVEGLSKISLELVSFAQGLNVIGWVEVGYVLQSILNTLNKIGLFNNCHLDDFAVAIVGLMSLRKILPFLVRGKSCAKYTVFGVLYAAKCCLPKANKSSGVVLASGFKIT